MTGRPPAFATPCAACRTRATSDAGSRATAIGVTPARVSASRPRPSASTAARPAASAAVQNSSSAGLPASAASDCGLAVRDRAPKTAAPGTARRASAARGRRRGRCRRPPSGHRPPAGAVGPGSRWRRAALDQAQRVSARHDVGELLHRRLTATRTVSARMRSARRRAPKVSVFECCERKPEPACTIFVLVSRSVSTTTRAPIASRLLLPDPVSRRLNHGCDAPISLRKMRSCGACRAAMTARS